jgi:vacuolar-type H+-ATPase subunit C/Vma6
MHHKLIKIAEKILCEIDKQMCHIDRVDTKELGEAVDMIKDLSEAVYYDVVTETMLKVDELTSSTIEDHHSYQARQEYLDAREKHMDKAI